MFMGDFNSTFYSLDIERTAPGRQTEDSSCRLKESGGEEIEMQQRDLYKQFGTLHTRDSTQAVEGAPAEPKAKKWERRSRNKV